MKQRYGYLYTLPLFVWVSLFFLVPIAIVLLFSILTRDPYGGVILQFSLDAYAALLSPSFIKTTLVTLFIAVVSTVVTIVIALPVAYYLARKKDNITLLLLVIIPFWVNFLIRVFAWMAILGKEGFLNDLLGWMGLTKEPIQFLFNIWAVIVVHIYTYLPFAILPLYSTIERFDFGLLEAARDLGATHTRSMTKVLLPNIRSGVVTSLLFTFIPILGSYAIPELVGGNEGYMLGNSIAYYVGTANNWPRASAISVVLTLITSIGLLVYFLVNRSQAERSLVKEEV